MRKLTPEQREDKARLLLAKQAADRLKKAAVAAALRAKQQARTVKEKEAAARKRKRLTEAKNRLAKAEKEKKEKEKKKEREKKKAMVEREKAREAKKKAIEANKPKRAYIEPHAHVRRRTQESTARTSHQTSSEEYERAHAAHPGDEEISPGGCRHVESSLRGGERGG